MGETMGKENIPFLLKFIFSVYLLFSFFLFYTARAIFFLIPRFINSYPTWVFIPFSLGAIILGFFSLFLFIELVKLKQRAKTGAIILPLFPGFIVLILLIETPIMFFNNIYGFTAFVLQIALIISSLLLKLNNTLAGYFIQ